MGNEQENTAHYPIRPNLVKKVEKDKIILVGAKNLLQTAKKIFISKDGKIIGHQMAGLAPPGKGVLSRLPSMTANSKQIVQIVKTVGGRIQARGLLSGQHLVQRSANPDEGAKVLNDNQGGKTAAAYIPQKMQNVMSADGKLQMKGLAQTVLIKMPDGQLQILSSHQGTSTNPTKPDNPGEDVKVLRIVKGVDGGLQLKGLLHGQLLVQLPDGNVQVFACQQSPCTVRQAEGAKVLDKYLAWKTADSQQNLQIMKNIDGKLQVKGLPQLVKMPDGKLKIL